MSYVNVNRYIVSVQTVLHLSVINRSLHSSFIVLFNINIFYFVGIYCESICPLLREYNVKSNLYGNKLTSHHANCIWHAARCGSRRLLLLRTTYTCMRIH